MELGRHHKIHDPHVKMEGRLAPGLQGQRLEFVQEKENFGQDCVSDQAHIV